LAAQLVAVAPADVLAFEENLSRRRLDEPVDHLEGRRLARPRAAEEDEQRALLDLEAHATDGNGTAELLGELANFDHRGARVGTGILTELELTALRRLRRFRVECAGPYQLPAPNSTT
jgi:hypothetical protein